MKREIKFRGLCTVSKKFVYGNLVKYKGHLESFVTAIQILNENQEVVSVSSVYEFSVGQFTGLKDSNGVEIYEGDKVVSFRFGYEKTPTKNVVISSLGCWRLKAKNMTDIPLFNYKSKELEVIGNIHEA